jgi:hypothetical protein
VRSMGGAIPSNITILFFQETEREAAPALNPSPATQQPTPTLRPDQAPAASTTRPFLPSLPLPSYG